MSAENDHFLETTVRNSSSDWKIAILDCTLKNVMFEEIPESAQIISIFVKKEINNGKTLTEDFARSTLMPFVSTQVSKNAKLEIDKDLKPDDVKGIIQILREKLTGMDFSKLDNFHGLTAQESFEKIKKRFGKVYATQLEEAKQFETFKASLSTVTRLWNSFL
ncbi:hypothetical protein L596_003468 [Steinernema carpocapsae]|uniref:Uncharacterized protein n=1 Tax=Steinernema carpocapsae TaxID=34508 RepID=A0A4U8UU98_STECR|nr:hypothetical protein L596_003468 [Steinernema carpocapsae]